jgi:hypothetical protein
MVFNIDRYSLTLKFFLLAIPLLFLVGLFLPYIFGYVSYSIYSLYITIPLMMALLIFYIVRKKNESSFYIDNRYLNLFNIFYFIIYFISILLLLFYEIRINNYFVIMSILYTTLMVRILFFDELENYRYFILFQIVLFFMNLTYGITLKYPQFIGRGDTIFHGWFIENLIERGWSEVHTYSSYSKFPLWHIFVSSFSIITKINFKSYKIMFLVNGIINSSVLVITYYVSKTLFNNEKIAYLTSLLLCIFPNFIVITIQSIPRGINGGLIAGLLFILLNSEKITFKILSLLVGLTMILFHHVSMLSVLVIYSIIYVLQHFYNINKDDEIVNLRFMMIIVLSIIGYWISYADFLLPNIIESLNAIQSPITYSTPSTFQFNEVLNYVQFSPYIFLSTIGILAMLWLAHHENKVKLLGVTGLGLLAFSIPNPISSINNIFSTLVFNRLMEYTSIFIVIIAAYGLFYIFNKLNYKLRIIFLIFIFLTCMTSIKNDFTASDNPLVKRDFFTFYLTTPEIESVETLCEYTDKNYIMADYEFWRFIIHSIYDYKGHLLEVDYNHTVFFKERDIDLIVIREGELLRRSLHLFATSEYVKEPAWIEGSFVYCYYDAQVFDTVNIYNRNYDNGEVVSYN